MGDVAPAVAPVTVMVVEEHVPFVIEAKSRLDVALVNKIAVLPPATVRPLLATIWVAEAVPVAVIVLAVRLVAVREDPESNTGPNCVLVPFTVNVPFKSKESDVVVPPNFSGWDGQAITAMTNARTMPMTKPMIACFIPEL